MRRIAYALPALAVFVSCSAAQPGFRGKSKTEQAAAKASSGAPSGESVSKEGATAGGEGVSNENSTAGGEGVSADGTAATEKAEAGEATTKTSTTTSDPTTSSLPWEIRACQGKTVNSHTFNVDFPARRGCTWDIGEAAGTMMGHYEQKQSLSVPGTWVVCSMKIATSKPDLYYDDYIMLHFDGKVLLGSSGVIDFLEKDSLGLPVFNWSRLQRKRPSGGTTCIPGSTKCALPGTMQEGALALELDESTNLKLMSVALKEKRFDLELVTTGDNDPDIDCGHTGVPLQVSVTYYTR